MEELLDKLEFGTLFGLINMGCQRFDDSKLFISENKIIEYKIIKIRVYLGYINGKKNILGIGCTYKNIFNGKIKETINKGNIEAEEVEEFCIKNNEYLSNVYFQLSDFSPNYDNIFDNFRFITNKNNQKFIGEYNGKSEIKKLIDKEAIIFGFFGTFTNRLETIGCMYIKSQTLYNILSFGFFILKHIAKRNKDFKNKWEKNYKNLPISYQYLWKAVNLPDDCPFHRIIKYLSYF